MAKDNETAVVNAGVGYKLLSVTRILIGWIFLWAFLDKLIGLGFTTCRNSTGMLTETGSAVTIYGSVDVMCEKAWLSGGAVTKGYLGSSSGPLADVFIGLAGQRWTDWIFMIGLLGIGLALILGIGTKIAAWSGIAMLAMMYVSHAWPFSGGLTNPFIDYHIIYGVAGLAIVLVELKDQPIGLGKWWRSLGIVKKNGWLL